MKRTLWLWFIPLLVFPALLIGSAVAIGNTTDTQTPAIVATANNTIAEMNTATPSWVAILAVRYTDSDQAPGVPTLTAWKNGGGAGPISMRGAGDYAVSNSIRDSSGPADITARTTFDIDERNTAAAILTAAGHTSGFHRTRIQV